MSARVFIAWLILAFAHAAATESADWTAGQQSFRDGDYQSALLHFQAARDSGLDGPAVHYNIAVCHFKLEQFDQAREVFHLIADRYPQMQGLAEYNLGLVARREGDRTAAIQHFLRSYEESPNDKKLRVLASNRLSELQPETRWPSNWSGAIGIRAGFDDNVALRDETGLAAGTTTDSPVADFFASIQGPWNEDGGFRVEASLYSIRNFDADEFDQTEIQVGALYDWRLGDWLVEAGVHFSAGSLGGDAFDRKAGVNAEATRRVSDNSTIDLRYSYDDVSDADALFSGVAGSRQQFQALYRWRFAEHRFRVRYRLEINDRDDPGVSPDRFGFGAEYRYRPGSGWGYEGGIAFRTSDYDDLSVARTEDLLTAHIALTHELSDDWLLLLDYHYSDNDSSDETFSYDRNQISLGAMRIF